MNTKFWILRNKQNGTIFNNSVTGKPFYLDTPKEAHHYLGCFGMATFGELNNQDWVVDYGGEILSFEAFCSAVTKASNDSKELISLSNYLSLFKKKYSLFHLQFMIDYLNDKLQENLKKESNTKGKSFGSFINKFFN